MPASEPRTPRKCNVHVSELAGWCTWNRLSAMKVSVSTVNKCPSFFRIQETCGNENTRRDSRDELFQRNPLSCQGHSIYTNRFVGEILYAANEVSVSAVLNGQVERQSCVERRHGDQSILVMDTSGVLGAPQICHHGGRNGFICGTKTEKMDRYSFTNGRLADQSLIRQASAENFSALHMNCPAIALGPFRQLPN